MIAIVNVSKDIKEYGAQDYEVRINKKVITTFKHRREDGLSVCLNKASAAVERARMIEVSDLIFEFHSIK